jgi:hypothetical protein
MAGAVGGGLQEIARQLKMFDNLFQFMFHSGNALPPDKQC